MISVIGVLSKGLGCTVSLFLITIVLALPLGLMLSFFVTGKSEILSLITRAFVFVMRGTPLMLQLFFFYFGLPFIPVIGKYLVMERFTAAALTFEQKLDAWRAILAALEPQERS